MNKLKSHSTLTTLSEATKGQNSQLDQSEVFSDSKLLGSSGQTPFHFFKEEAFPGIHASPPLWSFSANPTHPGKLLANFVYAVD